MMESGRSAGVLIDFNSWQVGAILNYPLETWIPGGWRVSIEADVFLKAVFETVGGAKAFLQLRLLLPAPIGIIDVKERKQLCKGAKLTW